MYCTRCGTSRPAGMNVCPNCGTAAPAFAEPPKIQNYLVPSILITLCCCVPAGIVAIIYAAQVNSKLAAGDIAGAQNSARLAKIWTWVGFAGGIVLLIIYAIVGFADAFTHHH
jgi:hypothetical protein